MIWSRGRSALAGAGLVLATVVTGQVTAAASSTSASKSDVVLKTFLQDIGAHKISDAKSLMTPTYEKVIATAADSLFTNVIMLTDITVGRVHYYGVRQANTTGSVKRTSRARSSSTSITSAVGTTAG
jgi:hypothetical protein